MSLDTSGIYEEMHQAFGVTAVETRSEQTADDVLLEARDDVEEDSVDLDRVATCPVYRSAVLVAYQGLVRRQRILIDCYRGQSKQGNPTHAFNYVDHEGGNSSWVDEF